jgi:L-aspartate oxidase
MSKRYDFLVLGGGIAGLSFALKVADSGSVAVLFKGNPTDSSTQWAQGGIAAVQDAKDTFESHINDTLVAGAGLCSPDVVELVIREAPNRIQELIAWGTQFDRSPSGDSYDLHQEGGHSSRRILHAADATGYEIQRALLARAAEHPSIEMFTDACAIDLITTHKIGTALNQPNKALGAYVLLKGGNVESFLAAKILVATGGAGKIYRFTTNPDVATGDGIAMCFRAGCDVANLEFFQFHPTCLYHPKLKNFLITEAMRGEGAILRRINGDPFMAKYDDRKELAPRDIVARAIDNEMKVTGAEHVLLDITHKSADFIISHFPTIYEKCLSVGLDITKEPIPVVPAAHYCCGGVVSDARGRTCISNLLVAGECSSTGLHGANRLASNSLLEGVVFGSICAEESLSSFEPLAANFSAPDWNPGSSRESDEDVVITQNWGELRRFMWNYVGIVRTNKRLERALNRSKLIEREITDYYWHTKVTTPLIELRNLSLVANLVIRSAMLRKESRGLHYNMDYPATNPGWVRDTVISPELYYHYMKGLL